MTTRDHLRLLWRRKWLLLAVLVLCLGIAVAYLLLTTPVYEARAELVVTSEPGPRSAILSAAAPVLSMLGEPASALGGGDLATQIQIIASRPSLEGGYGLMHERPEVLDRLLRLGMTEELLDELPRIVERIPAQAHPSVWPERYQAMLDTLMVARIEESDMIEVRCESADPELARDFVNALVLAYLGRSLADAQATTRRTRRYVEDQLTEVEGRLAEAEESLRQFGRRVGTVALDESARQQIGLLVRLTEQAAIARSTANARHAMQEELQQQLEAADERVLSVTVMRRNPQIAELQKALAAAEAERVSLLEEYAPDSMPLRRATASVDELRRQLAETALEVLESRQVSINPVTQEIMQEIILAQGEEMAARQSVGVLQDAARRVEAELSGLPDEQVLLLRLQREIELLERIYLALKEKQQEYEITERARAPASRLVEHAIAADEPARPRRLLSLAAGIAAGLLLGLLAVGAAEHLDERLHDPERAATVLGMPVMGVLGEAVRRSGEADEGSAAALGAVMGQIRASGARSDAPSVAVLAAPEREADAVAVATALAAISERQGERAVIASGSGPGLAELATEQGEPARTRREPGVVQMGLGETGLERLDAAAVERALRGCEADLVLIVPPPGVGALSVLSVLEAGCPVALVIDLRRTPADAARRLVRLLADHGADVIGAIAVGARRSAAEYYPAGTGSREWRSG